MPIDLHQKQAIVAEVRNIVKSALAIVVSENSGMTSNDMNELRAEGRKHKAHVRVVRNTLMRHAVSDTEMEGINQSLSGSLVLVFSLEEYGDAAQLVRSFAKRNNRLVPKAIAIGGQVLPPEHIEKVADLPTLDAVRVNLLAVLNVPATRLLRTLVEPATGLVRVLQTHADRTAATAADARRAE